MKQWPRGLYYLKSDQYLVTWLFDMVFLFSLIFLDKILRKVVFSPSRKLIYIQIKAEKGAGLFNVIIDLIKAYCKNVWTLKNRTFNNSFCFNRSFDPITVPIKKMSTIFNNGSCFKIRPGVWIAKFLCKAWSWITVEFKLWWNK